MQSRWSGAESRLQGEDERSESQSIKEERGREL